MGSMILLLLLACSPPPYDGSGADSAGDTAQGEDDSAASIEITWPAEESSVVACTLVLVAINNFTLRGYDEALEDTPGEGHYHVYYSTTFESCYAPYCLIDLTGLPEDGYVFTARLAENSHEAVRDENGNYIEDSVAINLTPGTCEASVAGLP